ncbi:MAG: hypothetical protein ACYSWQ_19055 [Planctomycetota bacterium]|jgi:hypothetical protein
MKSAKDIEQSIKKLAVESSDRIHARNLDRLLINRALLRRRMSGEES